MVLEKTLESPLDCKEIQLVHPKGDQSWVFIGRTDAEPETPVLWPLHATSWLIEKDSDAGKYWGAGGKGDDRGWDGWMASPTRCTWVWMDSRSWWWTGRLGMLWFTGSQRILHDWVTELNWTILTEWRMKTRHREIVWLDQCKDHLSNICFTSPKCRVMILGELALDKVVNLVESKVIQSLFPVFDLMG